MGIEVDMTDETQRSLNEVIQELNSDPRINQCLFDLRERLVKAHPNREDWPTLSEFKTKMTHELRAMYQSESTPESERSAALVVA